MAYGFIVTITKNQDGTFSGTLSDLDSGKTLTFKNELNLQKIDAGDLVDYTDNGDGTAYKLAPNLNIKKADLSTASDEVKLAFKALVRAMAKDTNQTTVAVKKF